ncbi:MAG TPA: cellulase family glycosylhydrolase [Kofleriaceae bacterium]|nr:cellulase family glycosylhydrolase [Kofleriaceae bacterium]
MLRSAATLVAIAVVAGCGDNLAGPCDGRDPVCGDNVRDAQGRALVLRGVNLAGAHKNAPYTDNFQPADYMRLRADWGMTAIRFLITWSAIEPSQGTFDDTYLDWVAERIDWAGAAGLSVVLDMHQDVYGEGFGFDGAPMWTCDASNYAGFVAKQPWGLNYADPKVMACFDHLWTDAPTQGELVAAWRHVAQRLADKPQIVGFDPINEPSWGSYSIATFERDRLQPFYESAIAAVREVAPTWVAFAEPSNSRGLGFLTSLQPFRAKDVVYSPHLYDVNAEQTGMFDPADSSDLVQTGADFASEAGRLATPVWIGEYGGQGADPEIAAYMGADYEAAAGAAAGAMVWAYDEGGGYSLLDASGNEVTPLVDAVVLPAPAAVAGAPLSWSFDPISRTFELRFVPEPTITAPTIIMTPERVYPTGVAVSCGGCVVELVANEVHVSGATGNPAVVNITPR